MFSELNIICCSMLRLQVLFICPWRLTKSILKASWHFWKRTQENSSLLAKIAILPRMPVNYS